MAKTVEYSRVRSYGSISSGSGTSNDNMIVHSQLISYHKRMLVEREILYEEEHPPFQALMAIFRIFKKARCTDIVMAYVGCYLIFLLGGAFLFSVIEGPIESEIRINVVRTKQEFLSRHLNITEAELEDLLDVVIRANNRGVSASSNFSIGPNWSFGQSLFFTTTVVTTIGYGHVTPLSRTGKIFCMFYATLGIPLTLLLLSALVDLLLLPTTSLLRYLNASMGHLFRPFTIRLMHLMIMVTILVTAFLLLPALIYSYLEPGWNYLDSLYYCFISLTTIGLGDYIPGDSPNQPYRPIYKVAITFYLFTGLTFLMLTLTVFYDIPQLNLSSMFSSMRAEEDPEKMRLSAVLGVDYGLGGRARRSVVQVRAHAADSPSPDDTTPEHARDLRLP